MLMRTWKSRKECHFCHLKEGDKLPWEVKSVGDLPGDNWEKSLQNEARLVEVSRDFSKEDRVVFYVCSKCMLLSLFDESRTNFRYGFRLDDSEDIQKEPVPEKVETETIERKEEEGGEEKEIQKEGPEEKKEEIEKKE